MSLMSNHSHEQHRVAAIENRLTKLEAENRRLRTLAAGSIGAVAVLFLVGAAQTAQVVSVRALELVDDDAKVRATVSARGRDGLALVVFGEGGSAASLRLTAAAPYLVLEDGQGNALASELVFQPSEPASQPAPVEQRSWPSWGRSPKDVHEDSDFEWDAR